MKSNLRYLPTVAVLLTAFFQSSCVTQPPTNAHSVNLIPAAGIQAEGTVSFTQTTDDEIKITGKVTGLSPGPHGMHVHTIGNCSDPTDGFKKSGGHFNPDHTHHGMLSDGHVGDLGNIAADATGTAEFTITTKKFNLTEGDSHSILGKALIIHAGKDDEKTDPAGNSGARILCGVI